MAKKIKRMKKARNSTNSKKKKPSPNYAAHIGRLRRIKGQIEGVERMIEDRRYCPEIMMQLRAASSALRSVEAEIFQTHLKSCLKTALSTRNSHKVDEKIEEIIKLLL